MPPMVSEENNKIGQGQINQKRTNEIKSHTLELELGAIYME